MTSATLTGGPGGDGTADRLGRTWQNASDAETLRLSLRELRLITERLLQAQGLALGAVHAVRDLVLHAQAAGLPALQFLSDGLNAADRAHSGRVEIVAESPGSLMVDCLGQSALVVAPALLDLLQAEPGERVTLWAGHVERAGLAAVLEHQGTDRGVVLTVTPAATDAAPVAGLPPLREALPGEGVLLVMERRAPELPDDPELLRLLPLVGSLPAARAVRGGVETPAALWWSLFEASARALSAESVTSLKHAGATAVDENGVIEPDLTDDVDFVGGTAKKEQEQR
ncbi:hypothetical protein [Streptomyces sp. DH41]|uniref:hypothetical protein n=1 Tax=Streptomyces sp. DH41 TaxID=3040125 RepID=UPI002441DA83|nr:hypothetical protein [Streptomyces sp. DH41]MDG9723257.1 hypothetical protein [Streptomyces sp. DH41]